MQRFFLYMMTAVLLLSCREKEDFLDLFTDAEKKAREEVKFLIEMPFDFTDIVGTYPMSLVRQMEDKGYKYTESQDDDLDKEVGRYLFSVMGYSLKNADTEFKNLVVIKITKKLCHSYCYWFHYECPLTVSERLPFIFKISESFGKSQEIWIDDKEVNPDDWSKWFEENHLAQNLFWQLEDRKIFIRKDSVDFVIKIFLQ